jgi:hypothetical protein
MRGDEEKRMPTDFSAHVILTSLVLLVALLAVFSVVSDQ